MAKIEEFEETKLWARCEALYAKNEEAINDDGDHLVSPKLVEADKRFEALYDLCRDLSSQADDLRQQVESLEEDDGAMAMEDAIRDVLHEYPNLVVLRHPLLRKLHDSIALRGLL